MDRAAVDEKLKRLSGKAGEIAKLYLAARSDGQEWEKDLRALREALNLSGRDMTAVFDDGPRQAFEALHGKAAADWAGQVAGRLRLYAYSPSSYRRSCRGENAELFFMRFLHLLDTLRFPWEDYDMARELSAPRRGNESAKGLADFCSMIYGDFLAVRIDEGDKAVIDAVKEIMLGDNNTARLSDPIISGIAKSENAELRGLLVNMLLAARLQEGLRQSILENADTGRLETLVEFMKAILDNDLLRYSSVTRAADVWMGLGLEAGDRRVTQKLLELGYAYLRDEKARKAAAKSKDVIELYAALWAESAVEVNRVISLADKLMSGKKHQRLVFLSFLTQTENPALQFGLAAKYLEGYAEKVPEKEELDLLCLVMRNYSPPYVWDRTKEAYHEQCRAIPWIADKKTRDRQFEALLNIIPAIPAGGYKKENTPFPWSSVSIERGDIFWRLLTLAAYDFDPEKIDRLIAVMGKADSANRSEFIKFFLDAPDNETKREYLFASLNDKSMPVRSRALENIVALEITDAEIPRVMSLLALKTGDIRQNALRILSNLETGRALAALKTLLADKNDHKRLAGLDLLALMLKENKIGQDGLAGLIALMPEATAKERVLIDALTAKEAAYAKENGFGLYDPNYVPQLPIPAPDKNNTLESIFGADAERPRKIFAALCEVIKANKDFTYKTHTWSGDEEAALGALDRVRFRAEAHEDLNLSAFERFVLQDVWRAWIKDNQVSYRELFLLMFIHEIGHKPPYQDWVNEIMEDIFHAKKINAFIAWQAKKEYGRLAMSLVDILWTEFPESERFAVLGGAIADLLAKVDEEKWKRPIYDDKRYDMRYGGEFAPTFSNTREVGFILRHLSLAVDDDDRLARYAGACCELGRREGEFYKIITVEQAARATALGLLKEDALYRIFFMAGKRNVSSYFGNIQDKEAKETAEKFPVVKKIADRCVARIIEIELLRGDSQTAVSSLASKIRRHEGAETFAKILVALGNETLFRGYYYSDTALTKKDVLSHLLRTCHPKEGDSAETLRASLGGKVSDKRVIEAAMYSPSWLDILEDYLGWPGFKNVRVENRFARIEGRLGEYTVHLGSAQAAKMGRGAVNILAVPSQRRGRVFLPFADDDPRTAEIMSKIVMLAEDGAIKDPAILAQIS
ncbi:MAG: DUF5724 domain-containing protein [Candidatus Adiutrix sp.]|jgi:hypothetical protein|nr:DUF5724 domain-containing protein [Candidatus Adiutrix sp.]